MARVNDSAKVKVTGSLDLQSLFVWVSTPQITWINKLLTYNFKQIGPKKRSAYRFKKDFISCIQSYLPMASLYSVKFSFILIDIFFFYHGFLSQTLTIHRTVEEGRGPSLIPLYLFYPHTNIQIFICNFACEMTITYF